MKKILFYILLPLISCFNFQYALAQNYNKNGNEYSVQKTEKESKDVKNEFTFKTSNGDIYPRWISANEYAYIIRISKKTGKDYKSYLGKEISIDICKRLNIEYKGK